MSILDLLKPLRSFSGRKARNFRQDHQDEKLCVPNAAGYCPCPLVDVEKYEDAELICSDIVDTPGMHKPVIDFDLPVQLYPSGTPGHCHLYIDRAISFDHYVAILKAFAEADIVQWGYVDATVQRGYGSVRHPDKPKKKNHPKTGYSGGLFDE